MGHEPNAFAATFWALVAIVFFFVQWVSRVLFFRPAVDEAGHWRVLTGKERLWWGAYLLTVGAVIVGGIGRLFGIF